MLKKDPKTLKKAIKMQFSYLSIMEHFIIQVIKCIYTKQLEKYKNVLNSRLEIWKTKKKKDNFLEADVAVENIDEIRWNFIFTLVMSNLTHKKKTKGYLKKRGRANTLMYMHIYIYAYIYISHA